MSELGVGKEVLSYCTKCKLNLAHIIVTMTATGNIGRCECKTCKARHAFKDPSTVKAKKARTRTKSKSKSGETISDLWLQAVSDTDAKSQTYSIKTQFKEGDIIDHPKFGPGVVEKAIDNDKVQVIFRHDIKTLIHNKK